MSREPPTYEQVSPYDDNASPSGFSELPPDFKYDVNVSGCELQIRQGFIRKVYTLLSIQLFTTFLTGFIIYNNDSIKIWCLTNIWLFYVSLVGSIAFLGFAYWKSKSYPYNLFLLLGFTICESYGIGMVTSLYDSNIVLQAILLTLVTFIGLTLFTIQTKYDFTQWQGIASIALFGMFSVGLVSLFLPFSSTFELLYSCLGALIFSLFILIDTQVVLTKCHPDEEIVATIMLYLDIINLFLFILRILSNREEN
ncbi:Bax inhibitor 1, involved in apoptosis [Komagataella phaffii CBS 7435]|uniref:Uncharacterized protein n=2 Tax=Komagataella phaffii TaxID=460519 RepID=C4R8R2_KOMPG|nr:uncharacterized protein PAS_chr4_0726 [Komagataella phaffii GS115]AOA65142.1 GQ67_05106T0 [Komagataella phaffii]KAI0463415.1 hypothetical protein LJB42_003442 [Komagataella kurtzmanii]CAH2450610.1 Bax inhibitor 1, involved in apoptosis [Komagataella phaffii CBS 7435]AOA69616.1 GQ68_05088T0 [Komagataella phaffii GS115]CAY71987.1 Putative protein of unknown function [Komagataella phaffii GS115]